MAEANGNGRDEISASGMGFSGAIKSKEMISTLIVVISFLVCAYVLYAQHQEMSEKFESMRDVLYLQAWQLSKPQDQRVPIMAPPQLWKYLDQNELRAREEKKGR